jgi:hypothetical protein
MGCFNKGTMAPSLGRTLTTGDVAGQVTDAGKANALNALGVNDNRSANHLRRRIGEKHA